MALSRECKAILKGKDKSHYGSIGFRAIIALLTFILMKQILSGLLSDKIKDPCWFHILGSIILWENTAAVLWWNEFGSQRL